MEICDWASRRATALIQEVAGGQILSQSVDVYPAPRKPNVVELRTRKVAELLGVDISEAEQKNFLSSLHFKVTTPRENVLG